MLPRIRERIANEVRQGGGNPFDQINFGADNNNNGNNNRNNAGKFCRLATQKTKHPWKFQTRL